MITGADGKPPLLLLQGQAAGVIASDDGGKMLVFTDPQSNIRFGIPMTDEQMDSIHRVWFGRRVIVASAESIPTPAQANGHG